MSKGMREFKKKLKQLKSLRGRNTELVTVLVPAGYALHRIVEQVNQEKGTAVNIKSKSTRKNVMTALEKTHQHLNLFKRTPENGLAVFVGNIGVPGNENWVVESIIPPLPLETRMYRCDNVFYLEPLEVMLETKEIYGMVLIERREASIALLKGKRVDIIRTLKSLVPGKFRAGGQSAARFERVREGLSHDFYKKVAEETVLHLKETKGLLIGGPGPTKEEFIERLPRQMQDKIITVQDVGYNGEPGMRELLEKSQDVLKETAVERERQLVEQLFKGIAMGGRVAYGKAEVMQKLSNYLVEILILSEGADEKLIEDFEEKAEEAGIPVEYISTETQSGQEFLAIGGIGAILR